MTPSDAEKLASEAAEASVPSAADDVVSRRLHPTSLFFGIGALARRLLLPAILVLIFARGDTREAWFAVLFIPSLLFEIFRYFTLTYRITGEDVIIRQGLIFRNERHIPLSRIQNVDLTQTPLQRLFKVAEVTIETGGGARPEAVLKVLSLGAVDELRARIFAGRGATGTSDKRREATTSADGPAQGELLLHTPPAELVKLGLMTNRGMAIVALGLGFAAQNDLLGRFFDRESLESAWRMAELIPGPLATALLIVGALVLLRLLSVVWMLLWFYDHRVTRVGDDLRLSMGLLTRRSATIPRRRIQVVSVRATSIQRWLGRAGVRIETAGGAAADGDESDAALFSRRWFVPIIARSGIPRILQELRPGLDFDGVAWQPLAPRARRRLMRRAAITALAGTAICALVFRPWGALAGVVLLPLALWHAWRFARFTRYAIDERGTVFFRSGAFVQQTSATFCDKVQTAALEESPFDRRWQMASVKVDTAGAGPAGHELDIPCLPKQRAQELVAELYRRAQTTTFRW